MSEKRKAAFEQIGVSAAVVTEKNCCIVCGKKHSTFSPLTQFGLCGNCNTKVRENIKSKINYINAVVNKKSSFIGAQQSEIDTALDYVARLEIIRPYLPFFQSPLVSQVAALNDNPLPKSNFAPSSKSQKADSSPLTPPTWDTEDTFDSSNNSVVPPVDKSSEPLKTSAFVGYLLLLTIPLVGFILAIVWGLSSEGNLNRRNLCRAFLIITLICVAAYCILWGTIVGIIASLL